MAHGGVQSAIALYHAVTDLPAYKFPELSEARRMHLCIVQNAHRRSVTHAFTLAHQDSQDPLHVVQRRTRRDPSED